MAGKKGRSGRPPSKLTLKFREFCREVINDPEVLDNLRAAAKKDPMFCLRLAEFGIGRPFQAVHVTAKHTGEVQTVREVHLHDGSPAFTAPEAVSDYGPN